MPSAARAERPPEPFVFFIDRSLGRKLGELLAASCLSGERVELHDDHFDQNAPDVDWLAVVGQRGWVVLAKDVHILTNDLEREAVHAARAAVFALARGHAGVESMAVTFRAALDPIRRALRRFDRPMLGLVAADGVVSMRIADGRDVVPPKTLRPHGIRRRR